MASVFEILSQNNYDPLNPVKSLIADEKAKLGLPTYVPYTEDFQFGTSESPTQTIYNPRKLELESEKKNIVAEANAAIATAQAATEQKQKDLSAVKNIEADEKFANYTGPEVPKTLSSDTSDIPDEYVLRGEAEDGGDLYLKSNGKSYAEVLKEYKAANGEEVSGAFFTKNAEDIIGNDRVSNEQREYLESGEALLPDGSYEPTEGRDFHAHLGEKQEIEAKAKAQKKRFEDILDRQDDELHGGEIAAKNNYDKMNLEAYNKQKEEEKLAIARKRRADFHENKRLDKIAEESDKAANENRYAFDPENAESYGEILAKGSEELQDALKSGEINNNSIGFNIAEQTAQAEVLAAEKAEKERLAELHNQQINSTTADDIADVKPSNAVAQQTEILAANLQDNKEKAVKVDKPSKSQIEKKYPPFKTLGNGDGSLHGKDPFRFTTLEYPTNITSDEQYGHFILFYVNVQNKTKYKYIGYNDDGNVKIVGDVVEKQTYTQSRIGADSGDYLGSVTTTTQPTSGDYTTRYYTEKNAGAEEVAYQKAQSYSLEGGGNILQSNQVTLMRQRPATQGIGSRMDLTSRITDSVALYLPSDIGNSTSTKYQGAELGMLGYLALGGADLLGQLQNRDFAGMGDTAVGMIDAAITEGLKKSAVTAADLFSGASTQGSIDKVFGQTVNPFIEVAFESMGVRSFEYTFNFTPKSKEETEEVKAIIQLFRFHMVPELKGTNHRYLTLPSTFDIHYMYQSSPEVTKENTYYNKIATCVLEDCNVSYTPTGVKSFDDGAPTQITMTLRFMETEMLTKEKVQQGF